MEEENASRRAAPKRRITQFRTTATISTTNMMKTRHTLHMVVFSRQTTGRHHSPVYHPVIFHISSASHDGMDRDHADIFRHYLSIWIFFLIWLQLKEVLQRGIISKNTLKNPYFSHLIPTSIPALWTAEGPFQPLSINGFHMEARLRARLAHVSN